MIVVVLQVKGLKDNARSQFRVNQESRVTDEIEHSERLCTGVLRAASQIALHRPTTSNAAEPQ